MGTKYKIGIWGQFGSGGQISDGQAVRTTIITNEIKSRYGDSNILVINTNGWKKKPLSLLIGSISLLHRCDKIVIFPADNGFKIVVPILYWLNKIYQRKLYDVVIGGYLPELLKNKSEYVDMLKMFKALFVQTANLKNDLEALGLHNIYILSNLKRLKTREESEIRINNNRHIKVCTLSRINESKGIDDAFEATRLANEKLGGHYIHLDLFGAVALEYQRHFDELLVENSDYASYCGILKYNETTETLIDYFAMLLPTFYYGEGFPGCVVDAYNSALPIIATDWNYNKEVIINGRNGYLVEPHNPHQICDALLLLYNDRELAHKIALNNILDSSHYKPDLVLKEFFDLVEC